MTFYRKLENMAIDHPPGFSPLMELYPGRLMPVTESYDRYTFPSRYPEEAKESFEQNKEDTQTYGAHLEDMARAQSPSNKKMTINQIEDPSAFIENPDLPQIQMQTPPVYGDALDVNDSSIPSASNGDIESRPKIKEHFGIVGTKQDRLFIAVFGLLALLVVIKMS